MGRLNERIAQLFERELELAQRDVQRSLAKMPKIDKLLMMAGFEAIFRDEPMPNGFEEVMARFEDLGGMEAQRRLELLETDAGRARAAELSRRMAAGEDWREIEV